MSALFLQASCAYLYIDKPLPKALSKSLRAFLGGGALRCCTLRWFTIKTGLVSKNWPCKRKCRLQLPLRYSLNLNISTG